MMMIMNEQNLDLTQVTGGGDTYMEVSEDLRKNDTADKPSLYKIGDHVIWCGETWREAVIDKIDVDKRYNCYIYHLNYDHWFVPNGWEYAEDIFGYVD